MVVLELPICKAPSCVILKVLALPPFVLKTIFLLVAAAKYRPSPPVLCAKILFEPFALPPKPKATYLPVPDVPKEPSLLMVTLLPTSKATEKGSALEPPQLNMPLLVILPIFVRLRELSMTVVPEPEPCFRIPWKCKASALESPTLTPPLVKILPTT